MSRRSFLKIGDTLDTIIRGAEASGQIGSLDRRDFLREMWAGAGIVTGLRPRKNSRLFGKSLETELSESEILNPDLARQQTLTISDHYGSINYRRPRRPSTNYIILHTTEGRSKGALERITRLGLSHYIVDVNGHTYRTVEKHRIAKHAGRSMWNGKRNLDNHSIGIEIVGYHNRDITDAQYVALRRLLSELQRIYNIPDNHVLAHAMVAYGWNRWEKDWVRGRRKDPMLLYSSEESLKRMGITEKPGYDPDVRAGRVRSIDENLEEALYGTSQKEVRVAVAKLTGPDANIISGTRSAWSIAGDRYDDASTTYEMPDGRRVSGNNLSDWNKIPTGTRIHLAEFEKVEDFEGFQEIREGDTAFSITGNQYDKYTTIYFLPDGRVRTGAQIRLEDATEFNRIQPGTKILLGYQYGGHVTRSRTVSEIAGSKWNHPSTFYRFPDGTVKSGDEIDPRRIPTGRYGTLVLFRR